MSSEQFGKNAREDYRSVTARIPNQLKRAVKARAAFDDIDMNTLVEGLLQLYADGTVTAERVRAATEGSREPATASPPARRTGIVEGVVAPDRVKQLRKRRGLTQAELGELLGRSRPTVSGYERGELIPPEVAAQLDELERSES